ncbi:transmembrane 14C domain protein [Sporothrix schenckii 1099-18]|uniref:Transmembrane 14C domain protein n=1 Tax=Sporothrix schenckii 1099-18 TaxID=1397361 RepID=A0A0F2LYM3_SPOSC|nr:transmembrane 14C domain protein [Sporothrix schenckii 1099-18]KJR82572.1 transmembrane 14C domain protein [Sporothrix schenckii 1099-18]
MVRLVAFGLPFCAIRCGRLSLFLRLVLSCPRTREQSLDVQSYVLAALTATGGVIGFARTGSVPSVVAGVAVGVLYGLGGLRQQNRQPYGVELSLLASVVLGGASIPRAIRLRKPVPVMLSLIAAYGLYKFGSAYFRRP